MTGFEFDIATPGLKTDYRSAALPTALPGPVNMFVLCEVLRPSQQLRSCRVGEYAYMHVYVCMLMCMRA